MSENNPLPHAKRPYATLDLKATEIKVTSIDDRYSASEPVTPPIGPVPRPAPARTYATPTAAQQQSRIAATGPSQARETVRTSSAGANSAAANSRVASSNEAERNQRTAETPRPEIIVQKRGGFFSHLAASLIGGAIALGAWTWGLPELERLGLIPMAASENSGIAQRLATLEKSQTGGDMADKLRAAESRLANVEKDAAKIAEMKEAQSRFVAETKAALASSAGDSAATEQLTRLSAIEAKLKAMSDAGANDPAAGRLEQLAALTGKVADLETSLATQLTALRKSVSSDVEARVVAATEAAEAAKSGTQRLDREIAGVKSDSAKFDERFATLKTEADRSGDALKKTDAELAGLKGKVESLSSSVAKPADIASAVSPVTAKLAALENDLKSVQKAEEERRSNAERVVLAFELQNLKRALDRGQKYDSELAQVEKVAAGKLDLAPLAKFKEQGVPTVADLTRDFRPSVNAMIDAETVPADGGVVDRLIAGAKAVVRVRKVSHDPDDMSTEAVAGRMEAALRDGRLNDVISEASVLSPKAKDAAQPFLEKVTARASVDKALASLEGQLKSSMSGGQPSKTE